METVPVLRLSVQEFAQLATYCAVYRSYLWQSMLPSSERNQLLRALQALQGRLEKVQGQEQEEQSLPLTSEEKGIIRQLLSGLLTIYGNTQSSEERTRTLGELGGLRVRIGRMIRSTQAL